MLGAKSRSAPFAPALKSARPSRPIASPTACHSAGSNAAPSAAGDGKDVGQPVLFGPPGGEMQPHATPCSASPDGSAGTPRRGIAGTLVSSAAACSSSVMWLTRSATCAERERRMDRGKGPPDLLRYSPHARVRRERRVAVRVRGERRDGAVEDIKASLEAEGRVGAAREHAVRVVELLGRISWVARRKYELLPRLDFLDAEAHCGGENSSVSLSTRLNLTTHSSCTRSGKFQGPQNTSTPGLQHGAGRSPTGG